MRWIVGASLRFRWLVVFAAAAMTAVRGRADRDAQGRRLPRVRAAAGGDPDRGARELLERGRGADHGPDRGAAQWAARPRPAALEVGRPAVVDRAGLRARDRRARARQLVEERLAQVAPTLPSWAVPPFMMPAAVGDEPDHEDRAHLRRGSSLIELSSIAYRKIRARLMRVPGVAQVAIWGQRPQQRHVQVDPARARRVRDLARAGEGRHRGRPGCGPAEVLRRAPSSAPAGSSSPAASG